MRTIEDIMARELVTFSPDTNIHSAIHVLVSKRISGAPVIDDAGNLVGVLSKKDCLKVVLDAGYHQDRGGPVSEYMSIDIQTIDADINLFEAAKLFLESHFRRFPVMRDNQLVGQISRHDVLKALIEES